MKKNIEDFFEGGWDYPYPHWLNLGLSVGNTPDELDGFPLVGFKGVVKHHAHIAILQKGSDLGQLIVAVKALKFLPGVLESVIVIEVVSGPFLFGVADFISVNPSALNILEIELPAGQAIVAIVEILVHINSFLISAYTITNIVPN